MSKPVWKIMVADRPKFNTYINQPTRLQEQRSLLRTLRQSFGKTHLYKLVVDKSAKKS